MHFHASWRIVPGKPIVISVIYAEGVRVILPPKADRPHLSPSGGNQTPTNQESPMEPLDSQAGSYGTGRHLESRSSFAGEFSIGRKPLQDAADRGAPDRMPGCAAGDRAHSTTGQASKNSVGLPVQEGDNHSRWRGWSDGFLSRHDQRQTHRRYPLDGARRTVGSTRSWRACLSMAITSSTMRI